MRVMRSNLLDVLGLQYIQTAKAKGLKNRTVIYKHAVKNAIKPIVMSMGSALPFLITGEMITSIVLDLPTTGPAFYNALVNQDMYLAGSFLMMIAVILIIGNLLADIALAWVDPRVRYN
jgi:peptide/nickel transport system permease protein